jgi:hypothetical protein
VGARFESKLVKQVSAALKKGADVISLDFGSNTRKDIPSLGFDIVGEQLQNYPGVAPHRQRHPGRRGQGELSGDSVPPGGGLRDMTCRTDQRVGPGPQHHLLQDLSFARSCS